MLALPREGCQLPDCLDDLNGAMWAPAHSGVSPGPPPWAPGLLPSSEPHRGQTSQLCIETKPDVNSLSFLASVFVLNPALCWIISDSSSNVNFTLKPYPDFIGVTE